MNASAHPHPAHRPSGIPWLGDMPVHWDVRRAGWLFRKMDRPVCDTDQVITCFRDGTVTLRKNRRTEGFTESLQEIGYQGIRRGDLVIHQMDAFAGAVGVSDSDGKGTPVYSVCHPTHDANPFYYAYVVREMASNQWILSLAKGIRERSTDFRYPEFARQVLPLPPLPEQCAIVRYLDYVDRRIRCYISAKRKLISLLEEEKQAVVNRSVTRGLDPNVRLKPSGVEWLGDVPVHWDVRRASWLFRKMDRPVRDTDQVITCFRDGTVTLRKNRRTEGFTESLQEIGYQGIRRGDLVIHQMDAFAGAVGVSDSDGKGTPVYSVCHPTHDADPFYYAHIVREMARSQWILALAKGIRQRSTDFRYSEFARQVLLLPPLPEQQAIVQYIDQETVGIYDTIARTRRQIELVQEYRTRLISDVVTGKLDVREAAAQLPEDDPVEDDGPPADGLSRNLYEIDESVEDSVPEQEVPA